MPKRINRKAEKKDWRWYASFGLNAAVALSMVLGTVFVFAGVGTSSRAPAPTAAPATVATPATVAPAAVPTATPAAATPAAPAATSTPKASARGISPDPYQVVSIASAASSAMAIQHF